MRRINPNNLRLISLIRINPIIGKNQRSIHIRFIRPTRTIYILITFVNTDGQSFIYITVGESRIRKICTTEKLTVNTLSMIYCVVVIVRIGMHRMGNHDLFGLAILEIYVILL